MKVGTNVLIERCLLLTDYESHKLVQAEFKDVKF